MVPLSALWLPVLLSAVLVFVASNILWMALPFWHRRDYGKLPDEAGVLRALSAAKSGMFIAPSVDWGRLSADERARLQKGPMALILLRNPASQFSFGTALLSYFGYALVISIFVAYLTGRTMSPGSDYLSIHRVAGTAGMLGYAFGSIPYSVWYGRPWSATLKDIVDGLIYGLLIGGTFGWLWPR